MVALSASTGREGAFKAREARSAIFPAWAALSSTRPSAGFFIGARRIIQIFGGTLAGHWGAENRKNGEQVGTGKPLIHLLLFAADCPGFLDFLDCKSV